MTSRVIFTADVEELTSQDFDACVFAGPKKVKEFVLLASRAYIDGRCGEDSNLPFELSETQHESAFRTQPENDISSVMTSLQ